MKPLPKLLRTWFVTDNGGSRGTLGLLVRVSRKATSNHGLIARATDPSGLPGSISVRSLVAPVSESTRIRNR